MNRESEVLAMRLIASYPAVPASRMTVLAIAEALDTMPDIAAEVVDEARSTFPRIPSVAMLYDVARDVRARVDARGEQQALPSPTEFVAAMPADVREKVRAMVNASRVERDHVAEDAAWDNTRAAINRSPRLVGTCPGSGMAVVVTDDGRRVCSGCGREIG